MANHLVLRGGLTPEQISGARIMRPCTIAGVPRRIGDELDEITVAAIPRANLLALTSQRFLAPFVRSKAPPVPAEGEVFLRQQPGRSAFDVIVGTLAAEGLGKAEALALADKIQAERAKISEAA